MSSTGKAAAIQSTYNDLLSPSDAATTDKEKEREGSSWSLSAAVGGIARVRSASDSAGRQSVEMEEERRRVLLDKRRPSSWGKADYVGRKGKLMSAGVGGTSRSAVNRKKESVGFSALGKRLSFSLVLPAEVQKRLTMVQEEKAMQAVPNNPIDANKFVQYVQERRKKRILFKGEFLMIKKTAEHHKCEMGAPREVTEKNQYSEILPYDYNRVVLKTLPGDRHSHYINATYIHGWDEAESGDGYMYVVAQAVKSKPACVDFWRMVWELKCNCIVMLTKVFDFMRVMCLQYWPMTKFVFGNIEVETLETVTYAHFVVRTLRISRVDDEEGGGGARAVESRMIKHFHFTEWELDSFPYTSAFIELRRRVRRFTETNPVDAPLLVHCSNGGARSGAFLAVDANLELRARKGQIDVFAFCRRLNNARQGLVDTVEQYQFIYDVLYEAVLCNVEPIAMEELRERSSMYKTKLNREAMEQQDSHENKLLLSLTHPLRIGDCAGGHRLENRGKNRDVMVVPHHSRPYLQTLHGESKDYTYINAVYVDGYTRKSEFIVAEWPKASTLDSFWALIFDHNCHTIINLSNQTSSKSYPPVIHKKGKQAYGPFIVEVINYHSYPSMTSHTIRLVKKRADQKHIQQMLLNRNKLRQGGGDDEKIDRLV